MPINRIAVFGGGTMGAAIAQHFIMKGSEVWLVDLNPEALEKARSRIFESLTDAKEKKVLSEVQVSRAMDRLKMTVDLNDIRDAHLVVEAVFEDLEVKRRLFLDLEKIVGGDCILATNTSSFPVTKIAERLSHPERCVGVHYFYHAAKNKLVEIIPGAKIDGRIVKRLEAFYRRIDKIPIVVRDAPGFAINRFFVPWLNEAVRLFEEGKGSIAFIDEVACSLFNIGMGPFALMNATGVPIAMHAAKGLASELGPSYSPAQALCAQVESRKPWNLEDTAVLAGGRNNEKEIRDRLLAASIGTAAQLVMEKVTDAASLDLGARVGLRWALGPFELAAKLGLDWPGLPSKLEHVRLEVRGSSALIVFDIPDRMNALSEAVVNSLEDAWNRVEADARIERVVFTGRGKAFVAGADIKFFLDCIERGDYARIKSFTQKGQNLFARISSSAKTTIAYLNGLTLGGGLELALCCRYRVATKSALLAFPETGIGIYPGLGGTQRSVRLLGRGLAKYLVATGAFVDAEKALSYGLVDQIVPAVSDENELFELGATGLKSQSGRARNLREEEFSEFSGVLDERALGVPFIKDNEKLLRRKSPKSLAIAMDLIEKGRGIPLDEALQLEIDHIEEIFKSQDAHIGLSCINNKTLPEFRGH